MGLQQVLGEDALEAEKALEEGVPSLCLTAWGFDVNLTGAHRDWTLARLSFREAKFVKARTLMDKPELLSRVISRR